jgi:hypothetical protein
MKSRAEREHNYMRGLFMFMALHPCNANNSYVISSRESCYTGYAIRELSVSFLYANCIMISCHSPHKYLAIYHTISAFW